MLRLNHYEPLYIPSVCRHNCSFCVHGDDITMTADGTDTYHIVKTADRYKECQRTQGVSTTNLVGRMLMLTKDHLQRGDKEYAVDRRTSADMSSDAMARSPWTGLSQFLPTTQKILQFSNKEGPKKTDKIVYVAGAFDLFHIGHLDFLEKAKEHGTYLIVGLHTDPVVNRYCQPVIVYFKEIVRGKESRNKVVYMHAQYV